MAPAGRLILVLDELRVDAAAVAARRETPHAKTYLARIERRPGHVRG